MAIRTLEFPVVLEHWQRERIEVYFQELKKIWNIGLTKLNEFDTYRGYYSKDAKAYNPCCPMPCEYKRYWLDKDGSIIDKPSKSDKAMSEPIIAPFSRLVAQESKHLLKQFPQVKVVTPSKRKTALDWLNSDKLVVVTTDRFKYAGVEAIDGCSGFSCPIVPAPETVYEDSKGKLVDVYPELLKFWNETWESIPEDERSKSLNKLPCHKNPLLSHFQAKASGGLGLVIKKENLTYRHDKDEILSVPYKFRSGMIGSLSVSWQEYDKSRKRISTNGVFRGKPRFKTSSDKITTLIHSNPKGVIVRCGVDTLKGVPELKQIKVPGLDKRWRNQDGSIPEILLFKICKCASGWYVQLTGDLDHSQGLRPEDASNKAIAGDPGLLNYLTFDNGKHIENPRFWRKEEEKLAKLQKQLAHKRSHNLILWLNHPDRQVKDITSVIDVADDIAEMLLTCKSEQEGKKIINQSKWARLIFKRGEDSKAIQQLDHCIKKQHERIRRMRRSFAHRLSTWLVRNFSVFVCEDGLQKEQLRHRAGIKLDENDIAQKNNSGAKSGLTKSLSDAAHGQLLELCAQKFKEAGRSFIRYPARATTLECPICGTDNKMESNHEGQMYECNNCGWKEGGRDQKPGILMLMRLMETVNPRFLASSDRYKKDTTLGKLIHKHKGLITLEMVSTPVKDAVVYQQNWLASSGGCTKRRTRKKSEKVSAA